MKKYLFLFSLIIVYLPYSLKGQTEIFDVGSFGSGCFLGSGTCPPQPNYDLSANPNTGNIFLLKHEVTANYSGVFADKIIRFDSSGNRLKELVLRAGEYKKVVATRGTGIYILSVHNDSVYVTCHNHKSLSITWSTGISSPSGPVEAFDMINAFGGIYFGFNNADGMHIYKLNKFTGAIENSVHYQTPFASLEHGVDIAVSSTAIFIAGYLDQPGTVNGEEFWLIKFDNNLTFRWQKRYNNNLSLTNNSDRASHVRVVNNTIYVCGISTLSTGDQDAVIMKYNHQGTLLWRKVINKGTGENNVDCAIDVSNGDAYLLQNATDALGVSKIFVTRISSVGTILWTNGYASTDTIPYPSTIGYNIFVDANPGGTGCEIYVSGQRQDYGGDPHGYTYGTNLLFYKINRSNVISIILAPDTWSGPGGLAPRVGLKQAFYSPDYPGGPRMILAGDGDYNLSTTQFGWRLLSYDISSTARLSIKESIQSETTYQYSIQVYPNPAYEKTLIVSDQPMKIITILNLSGQIIKKLNVDASELLLDVSELPKGIYFIKADFDNDPIYSRLIVQ